MVLPSNSIHNSNSNNSSTSSSRNSTELNRTIATQTDDDLISQKGEQLCYMIIQELADNRRVNIKKDEVYESLFYCVCEILERHSILFNGMVNRIQVIDYQKFSAVANELFEANANNETGQLRITWGRIASLFAFAVRLSQHYHETSTPVDSVDCVGNGRGAASVDFVGGSGADVTNFLSQYLTKNMIPWIRDIGGGWQGLVDHFPPPVPENDAQFKRAVIWSGLCVGLMATIYVTSLMKH